MPKIDRETQKIITSVNNGTMADDIKKNIKYTTTGLAIGAGIGFIIAAFTGNCRLCFSFWGALGGGGTGYVISKYKKKKDENLNCCI